MEGYIGVVTNFAAPFAPRNWAYCAGQIMSIAQNTALFSLLGTTYGGNGVQTFALPDTRGRAVIGTGQGAGLPYVTLGEMDGYNTVTLTSLNLAPHTHVNAAPPNVPVPVNNTNAILDSPTTGYFAVSSTDNAYASSASDGVTTGAIQATVTCQISGSNVPLQIEQPSLGMNFIICLYGIFPSRN